MKELLWRIAPLGSPAYLKKCSRCGKKTRFYNSENFRINAQQKNLDVWLIYRCEECDRTWNIELYSRVSPKRLAPVLYQKLLANDARLAQELAFDRHILCKNQIEEVDYERVSFRVTGDLCSLEEAQTMKQPLKITMDCPLFFDLSLAGLLRECWGISRSALKKLEEQGELSFLEGSRGLKAKLQGKTCFYLDLWERQNSCHDLKTVELLLPAKP